MAQRDPKDEGANVSHEVDIAGIKLRLKSGHDSGMVKKLVSLVDKKVTEALPATKSGSIQNAALLACLNMAEEMFEFKSQMDRKLEQFEKRTEKVLNDLESSRASRAPIDN